MTHRRYAVCVNADVVDARVGRHPQNGPRSGRHLSRNAGGPIRSNAHVWEVTLHGLGFPGDDFAYQCAKVRDVIEVLPRAVDQDGD